jgi:CxxC motif-containing protein (DUF1111 family)
MAFAEAVDGNTLTGIAAAQPDLSDGVIQGKAIQVAILETLGQTRIGRFGWKDQHGSLLSFIADAYLNEMGVTSRLKPVDTTSICKITPDPKASPMNSASPIVTISPNACGHQGASP